MSRTKEYIPDYDESRARTEHLKAELLEIDRQQKEGKLVPAEEVEAKWVEIVTLARSKMLGIPSKAKQRIPDLDAAAMKALEDIVRETLEDLSGESEEMSNIDLLKKKAFLAFKPPKKLTLSEWADENAFLSAESSAEGGRWRTLPYQKG